MEPKRSAAGLRLYGTPLWWNMDKNRAATPADLKAADAAHTDEDEPWGGTETDGPHLELPMCFNCREAGREFDIQTEWYARVPQGLLCETCADMRYRMINGDGRRFATRAEAEAHAAMLRSLS